MCRNCGLEIDADINTCLNIAHKTGYSPPTPGKTEAFLPTHQGATPLNEKKDKIRQPGAKTMTPRRVTGSTPQ